MRAPRSTADVSSCPRGVRLAALEGRGAGLDQLLPLALALGDRAARALDVGAGAGVAAVEEQDARPDVDRELVLAGEIVVEPGEEELFDARVTIALGRSPASGRWSVRSGSVIESGVKQEEVPQRL